MNLKINIIQKFLNKNNFSFYIITNSDIHLNESPNLNQKDIYNLTGHINEKHKAEIADIEAEKEEVGERWVGGPMRTWCGRARSASPTNSSRASSPSLPR